MHPVQRILATLTGLALLVAGFMFSIVIIPVIVLIGVLGLAYFYWKTRPLRKAMAGAAQDSQIIEGEAVVVEEAHDVRQIRD